MIKGKNIKDYPITTKRFPINGLQIHKPLKGIQPIAQRLNENERNL